MKPDKKEFDEEEQAFLSDAPSNEDVPVTSPQKQGLNWRSMFNPRLLLELSMAATILVLLVLWPSTRDTIRKTPVPKFPKKIYTFLNNPKYLREDMFFNETLTLQTLHNWIELSSDSRGYISLPDPSAYDLPTPYTIAIDRHTDGPGYMITVFHQLHCLSYLAEHFQQGYGGVELTEEVAHHSVHCFSYLRQGLMCNADTTLEGKTEQGPGQGSEHECVDYDAVLEWANKHAALKWRNGLLPDESTL
ncbi:hypothetical protein DM02DRAFT_723703 [Periconia macrospinosa]|uniref:Oxidase ustYa n=1 Tax=Periconia macrospinosa TaxID=97972 RepID=A0A2V1ECK0_9PLEO|nr:hypothetical protein DM02DRAFT_723703 [Periconia macrospinosa]